MAPSLKASTMKVSQVLSGTASSSMKTINSPDDFSKPRFRAILKALSKYCKYRAPNSFASCGTLGSWLPFSTISVSKDCRSCSFNAKRQRFRLDGLELVQMTTEQTGGMVFTRLHSEPQ